MTKSISVPTGLILCGFIALSAQAALHVDFVTDAGTFTVEMDALSSPVTVANFLGLADGTQAWRDPVNGAIRGSSNGDAFYRDMKFYSTYGTLALLGGLRPYTDGDSEFWEDAGYTITDSWTNGMRLARGDVVAPVFRGPHSGGTEFAVILSDAVASSGHEWSRFGRVTGAGMAIVDAIIGEITGGTGRVSASIVIRDDAMTPGEIAALQEARGYIPVVEPSALSIATHGASLPRISFLLEPRSQAYLSTSTNLLKQRWSVLPGDWNTGTSSVSRTISIASIPDLLDATGFVAGSRSVYPRLSTRSLPSVMKITAHHSDALVEYQLDFETGSGVWAILENGEPVFTSTLTGLRQWITTANSVAIDFFIVVGGSTIYRDIYWFGLDEEGAMAGRFYYESWLMNAILEVQDWGTFVFEHD